MLNNLRLEHIQATSINKLIALSAHQYQFHLITYGQCIFQLSDNNILYAKKGDFILLPENSTVKHYVEQNTVYESYYFEFNAFNSLIEHLPLLNEKSILKNTSGLFERTLDRLRPIWQDEQESTPYNQLRIGSLLLDTLAMWQREVDRGELSPASNMQVERMKSYIQNHYREKVTKDTLGEFIRRTPSYAASLFKKGTGQTISEYVHAVRLKTGLYMLNNSLLNVTEIAEYLGYSDVSYFQRLFKRTYGKTASEFIASRERV